MKKIICLLVFGFGSALYAQKLKNVQPSDINKIPSPMFTFRAHILDVYPHLKNVETFSNPEKINEISSHLKAMAENAKNLKSHERLSTPFFTVPATELEKIMHEASNTYNEKNYARALRMTRSALHGCTFCHTSVSKVSAPLWEFEGTDLPKDPLEQAELWFLIRDYDRALSFYNAFLSRYQSTDSTLHLKLALKRRIQIGLKILRDPKATLDMLTPLKNEPQFPALTLKDIEHWKNELTILKSFPAMDLKTIAPTDLIKSIEKILEGVFPVEPFNREAFIPYTYVSGILSEFISLRSKEVQPKMLYYLGALESRIDHDLYMYFGENYLKACVEQFPKDPVAKLCFDELNDYWNMEFTGTSGNALPKEYKKELKRLEQTLKTTK